MPKRIAQACVEADFGITSADYALAETGTLVMISGAEESRLVSLLPPAHIAVVPVSRLLENLDELLHRVPQPADGTSSMVLITGPSRTADIEQILVRGVHGPGEITVCWWTIRQQPRNAIRRRRISLADVALNIVVLSSGQFMPCLWTVVRRLGQRRRIAAIERYARADR